jgi:crotonobetainyl-CoA:carnitine CoA-transferase CaiB-like acyl-CoA transferase
MDAAAGACIAFAVMAALYRRHRTGKGQFIDVAQAETIIPQMGQAIMDYTMNGRDQTTLGNRDPSIAPQGCYQCLGKDKWAVISVEDDRQWGELCRIIGRPELATAPRFADVLSRNKNHDELDRIIEQWTLRHAHYEVMHLLQDAGIAAGAVMEPGDCLSDPHLEQRGFYETITHPEAGTHPYPGFLWKMSKTPSKVRHPPPCLGEHNEYVYKKLLNVSDEEYALLEQEKHIGKDYIGAK